MSGGDKGGHSSINSLYNRLIVEKSLLCRLREKKYQLVQCGAVPLWQVHVTHAASSSRILLQSLIALVPLVVFTGWLIG